MDKVTHVQDFVKHMLKGRFFIGAFQEKRYVANINAYRDLIVISKEERELIKDLQIVKERIRSVYKNRWIGITTPETIGAPVGHCLWVDLQNEVFGSYWYKIRSVKFCDKEILLTIKTIRPVNLHDESHIPYTFSNSNDEDACTLNLPNTCKSAFDQVQSFLSNSCSHFFTNIATLPNIKSALIFTFLLIVTLGTACIHVLCQCPEYFLKLLKELSHLIKAITPIVIVCIETLGKIVGGIFILIAMMFGKTNYKHVKQPSKNCMITSGPNYTERFEQPVRHWRSYTRLQQPLTNRPSYATAFKQPITIREIYD